jgi:hypothetical protein
MKRTPILPKSLLRCIVGGAALLASWLFAGCASSSRESYAYSAGVEIGSVDEFYGPLSSYGEWVEIGGHGRCWRPTRVYSGWRPYSDGYWVHTDAGWYWRSEEPWGWATYHYGGWDYDPGYGWYWVPQTRWAPAWVTWRSGGGYVGWAPLRPRARFETHVTIRDDGPENAYVFVPERRFVERVRPRTVIVNNPTIVRQTVNITNVRVDDRRVVNVGPRVDEVQKASGTRVQSARIEQLRRDHEAQLMRARAPSGPPRAVESTKPERSRSVSREAPATDRTSSARRERSEVERSAPTPQSERERPRSVTPAPAPRAESRATEPPTARSTSREAPPVDRESRESRATRTDNARRSASPAVPRSEEASPPTAARGSTSRAEENRADQNRRPHRGGAGQSKQDDEDEKDKRKKEDRQ